MAMVEDPRNPSPRLRAAAKVIHDAGVEHKWAGPAYQKTYEYLKRSDPIGFEEFNEIVAEALAAADDADRWMNRFRRFGLGVVARLCRSSAISAQAPTN